MLALMQTSDAPSFRSLLLHHRVSGQLASNASSHPHEPSLQLPFKLRNIALAESHGIRAPHVFEVWHTIDSIAATNLPDNFVLKADGGASAHAVFVLQKEPGGGFLEQQSGESVTIHDIRTKLRDLGNRARAPYYAEEVLESASNKVLEDAKLYCAYGQVLQVLLTRPKRGVARRTQNRYLSPKGVQLEGAADADQAGPRIDIPDTFEELKATARHLSRAVGTPFCRVDLYSSTQGVVFGEITRAPGGNQVYPAEHDAMMGEAWLKAHIRLEKDIAAGRPRGAIFGPHAYHWNYGPPDGPRHPSSWHRAHSSCEDWCGA